MNQFSTTKPLERPLAKMRREPPYLYMNSRYLIIIIDPLFSHLISQNPQQIYNSSLQILNKSTTHPFKSSTNIG